ncbi:DMT family transporter [Nonomuraea sp. NPDC049695]|uniref:DMT family transporter n=1 Tax=Nonomuraea sp. NPDC049695 TaxID=3154734 RepID=UPI0034209803
MSSVLRGRIMLLLSAAGWSLLPPASKSALGSGFAPLDLLAVQLATATAVLGVVVWRRGARPVPPIRHTLMRALLEPIGNVGLFLLGLAHLTAAYGSLLLTCEGLLTAVLAVVVLHERLAPRAWAGLLAGVPGLWLLLGTPTSLSVSTGSMLVLAGVACSAAYATMTARAMRQAVDVITTTAVQVALALAISAPLALALKALHPARDVPAPAAWIVAIASGLLLAGPTLLYNSALACVSVGESAVIYQLIPVFGAGLGVLLLGETVNAVQILGAVLTLTGVLAVVLGQPSVGTTAPHTARR